jgi:uronate dehydrogenase
MGTEAGSGRSRDRAPSLRVLITGAAGAIGDTVRRGLAGRYVLLRLADIKPLAPAAENEEIATCDITDAAAVAAVMRDIDCVVHLAGVPREGPWDAILPNNIVGTYNVFEQARAAGVKRIVYASSNHVVGYYRAATRVGTDVLPRPDSRYGVSKVFGEAMARLYADKHGISVACLRIGSFRKQPEDARQLATWISPRDMTELVRCAIEAQPYHYLTLYGVSANTRARWDNPDAACIGYVPQDNAERFASVLESKAPAANGPAALFHGGSFCAMEWSGDVDEIA